MFILSKEDRKIKKIVKSNKKIYCTKEDLKELKYFIHTYQVTNPNTIKTIASLTKDDRSYLNKIMIEYFPRIKEIQLRYENRDCIDEFIGKTCSMIQGGGLREKEGTGYRLGPNDMEYISDIIDILSANSFNVYLSEELGKELTSLFEDGKYALFVHRPHAKREAEIEDYIVHVFARGLINHGHGGYTGNSGSDQLDKTFLTCQSKAEFIHYVKASCDACYKGDGVIENNRGVVVAKIPIETLRKGENIWYRPSEDSSIHILHPSYIDGFLHFDCTDAKKKITSYTHNTFVVPDIEKTDNDTTNVYYEGSNRNRTTRK